VRTLRFEFLSYRRPVPRTMSTYRSGARLSRTRQNDSLAGRTTQGAIQMVRKPTSSTHRALLAVNSPGGGRARQFRVQYRRDAQSDWRLFGSFQHHDRARNCINELRDRGLRARVILYAMYPTAN